MSDKTSGPTLANWLAVECLMEIVDFSDHRLIRLAGRLTEAQVPELLKAHAGGLHLVQLHLGDLISVDTVGLDTLEGLRRGGAQLVEVPAYIQLKLDSLSAKRASRRR
jgi:hypothetical protein